MPQVFCLDFETQQADRLDAGLFYTRYALPCATRRDVGFLVQARLRRCLKDSWMKRLKEIAPYTGFSLEGSYQHLGVLATDDPQEFLQAACDFSPALLAQARKTVRASRSAGYLGSQPVSPRTGPMELWDSARANRSRGVSPSSHDDPASPHECPIFDFENGTIRIGTNEDFANAWMWAAPKISPESFWDAVDARIAAAGGDACRYFEHQVSTAHEFYDPRFASAVQFPHHGIVRTSTDQGLALAKRLNTPASREIIDSVEHNWTLYHAFCPQYSTAPEAARGGEAGRFRAQNERAQNYWNLLEKETGRPTEKSCVFFSPAFGSVGTFSAFDLNRLAQKHLTPAFLSRTWAKTNVPRAEVLSQVLDCHFAGSDRFLDRKDLGFCVISPFALAVSPKESAARLLTAACAAKMQEPVLEFICASPVFASLGTARQRSDLLRSLVKEPRFLERVQDLNAQLRRSQQNSLER